jgi:signal transduction histidine kinase
MTAAALSVREGTSRISTATALAFIWAAANAVLLVVGLWLDAESRAAVSGVSIGHSIVAAVAVCTGTAVGASIAARFPRNPVGWLVLSALSLFALDATLQPYGLLALGIHEGWVGGAAAAGLDEAIWLLVFGVVALVLLLFPTGSPPAERRWRVAVRAIVVVYPLAFLASLLGTHQRLDPPLPPIRNPWAVSAFDRAAFRVAALALVFCCLVLLAVGAASVAARFRRADPAQRAQLKWMVVAGLTVPTTLLACLSVAFISPAVGDVAGSVGFSATLIALPLAMGLAMSRYRLYSVDRFVDSALVYLALTALVTAVYAVVVLGSGRLAGTGGRSPVVVALATLVVGASAAPVRRRLAAAVARRFHRRRYDAVRAVENYVRLLRDELTTLRELEPTLARALGDPTMRLGLWHTDSGRFLATDGTTLPVADPTRSAFHVTRAGAPIAVLVHDPALDDEPLLMDDVTRAATLPLDNARLNVEVLARLRELQASRQRIVAAAYEERRRIERDLHDGAQQRLVSLALSLRLARERLTGESVEILDEASAQLAAAVHEVRELARGIHPATLSEEGLGAALETLADRIPLTVELDVTEEPLPDDVAASAYFTACEAVTNVVKHACATQITIRTTVADARLVIDICDNGAGGADMRAGGGLQGLADRLDALGGRLSVTSTSTGTRVRAELPCAQ